MAGKECTCHHEEHRKDIPQGSCRRVYDYGWHSEGLASWPFSARVSHCQVRRQTPAEHPPQIRGKQFHPTASLNSTKPAAIKAVGRGKTKGRSFAPIFLHCRSLQGALIAGLRRSPRSEIGRASCRERV